MEAAPALTEWTRNISYNTGGAKFGLYGVTKVEGTTMTIGDGANNTSLIIDVLQNNSETGRAAQLCDALIFGPYSDWYLPSAYELKAMYDNLHLAGLGGFNQDIGEAEYSSGKYWSSTHTSQYQAYIYDFAEVPEIPDTRLLTVSTDNYYSVRAIRKF